ncbi:putative P-loop containing nucleoside triphosphate hydrolase [Helianthus debilis subsp. tardiflorus]
MNVALHIKPDSLIHRLRFLTVEESWDLLQQKVFADDGCCPINLQETGKQIAERCRGLPLAILVISGLLAKTEKSVEFWSQVLDSMGSYIVSDSEQCMNTLSLSYNHLPQHLKSCFLYFGAFKEDFEISVRKLMWQWVAEGFVKSGTENVAEEYLVDLIDRSLVVADQKRSDTGVKVCRVHDLLHDLCLKNPKKRNFCRKLILTRFQDWVLPLTQRSAVHSLTITR